MRGQGAIKKDGLSGWGFHDYRHNMRVFATDVRRATVSGDGCVVERAAAVMMM